MLQTVIRTGLLLLALTLPVLIDPGAQVMAQSACEQELSDAEEAYNVGRFDEAIGLLNQCLDRRNATAAERRRAYRLIGLSYIGKDRLNEARASVRRLLELVPDYRPDPDQDPPPFVEMVEEIRQEMRRDETPLAPSDRTTTTRKKSSKTKWLLIGGGVVLAGVAAAVLLAGGGKDDGGNDGDGPTTLNEVEPNNTDAQAQVLRGNPPITVNGNVDVNDNSDLGINLDLNNDGFPESFDDFEDWYRVTITQPGIQISLTGLSADCDLYLMDPSTLNFIGSSDSQGIIAEQINIPNQPAGTYLIAVSIYDIDPQGPTSTAYTLTVDGAISGNSLRVMAEQIQNFGGAGLTDNVRLVARAGGEDVSLNTALPPLADVSWTAYRDEGGTLTEYDGTDDFRFRPGQGVWVQSTEPVQMEPATAPPPTVSGGTYDVPLHAGWNIISNPFDAAIDWSAVQEANGITQNLWRWEGRFVPATTFEPARRGEAYYFMNLTHREALAVPLPGLTRTTFTARQTAPRSVLTVSAYREGRQAAVVQAGFADDAAPGFDAFDQLAPPGYFEAASLRLVRDVSSVQRLELADEYRPWDDGQQFDLVLRAPAHAPVELRVDGLETFAGYDVYLIDLEKSIAYDLREQPVLNVTSTEDQHRFRLIIGTETFASAARDELVPEAVALSNYPNPFNPRTQITYTISVAAAREPVRLEVFDVAGHRVRVLVDGIQEAGTHRVEWDGTNVSGMPVASGLYLYRLHTGADTYTRTMLLMK